MLVSDKDTASSPLNIGERAAVQGVRANSVACGAQSSSGSNQFLMVLLILYAVTGSWATALNPGLESDFIPVSLRSFFSAIIRNPLFQGLAIKNFNKFVAGELDADCEEVGEFHNHLLPGSALELYVCAFDALERAVEYPDPRSGDEIHVL